jgi:hypothetical protein
VSALANAGSGFERGALFCDGREVLAVVYLAPQEVEKEGLVSMG